MFIYIIIIIIIIITIIIIIIIIFLIIIVIFKALITHTKLPPPRPFLSLYLESKQNIEPEDWTVHPRSF